MSSALELKLSNHKYEQRTTEHAINQHSKDITNNEKDLEAAKKQLKALDESLHTSSICKSVLNAQIKKYEEVLKTKRQDHSHATGQRQQHADNIRTTEAALLHAKKAAPAKRQLMPALSSSLPPADLLQSPKELQMDIHMHNWMTNEKGYKHSEEDNLHSDKTGKAHTLTKNKGRYQIEEQR